VAVEFHGVVCPIPLLDWDELRTTWLAISKAIS